MVYWDCIIYGEGVQSSKVGWHQLHLSAQQIKKMWTQHKWWNWFWKTNNTQFEIYPLHWSDLWKLYPTLSVQNWDTAVCECMVGTKMGDGSSQKLMFGGALSLLQPFKGGTNGPPESMVTWWGMGSPFYSKWALMLWTHLSSLRPSKCEVCQYSGSLWHLYSVLQESSALYSYFRPNRECERTLWHAALTALGY